MSWDDVGVVEIPLHGKYGEGKVALVDGDYDGEYFSQFRWVVTPNGYVGRGRLAHFDPPGSDWVMLHTEVLRGSTKNGEWVDHINRNKLDNRSCNLRLVSPTISSLNRGLIRKSKAGYRGVSQYPYKSGGKRFQFILNMGAKRIQVGGFASPEAAARAYDIAAREVWGEDAPLNFG